MVFIYVYVYIYLSLLPPSACTSIHLSIHRLSFFLSTYLSTYSEYSCNMTFINISKSAYLPIYRFIYISIERSAYPYIGHATVSGDCHWQMGTPNLGQPIIIQSTSTEMPLEEYYTTETSHHRSCTYGANGTHLTVLGAQESHLRLSLSHSLPELFSQDTATTRPPHTAEENYTARIIHPRHHSPTTRQLHAGTSQDVPGKVQQYPPPHTRLPAHVTHEAAIPAVIRDALQSAGK